MIDNFYMLTKSMQLLELASQRTLTWNWLSSPLLATATEAANESDAEEGTLVLAGVLLS